MAHTTSTASRQAVKKKSFVVTPVHDLLLHDLNTLQRATAEPSYRIGTMQHERVFKNAPIKAAFTRNNREETKAIVPDCYVTFVYTYPSGKEETIPVLWELDRGTEDQKFFRKRLRGYAAFLKSRSFKTLFGIENITVAFATTKDYQRVRLMREWAAKEFATTNEPGWTATHRYIPRPTTVVA